MNICLAWFVYLRILPEIDENFPPLIKTLVDAAPAKVLANNIC